MKTRLIPASNGLGNELPPSWHHVSVYFSQQGSSDKQAKCFFKHYQQRKWLNDWGQPLGNWKKLAWTWIWYRT